jgi:hypothetical protein
LDRREPAQSFVTGTLGIVGALALGGGAVFLALTDSDASLPAPPAGGVTVVYRTPPSEPAGAKGLTLASLGPLWHEGRRGDFGAALPLRSRGGLTAAPRRAARATPEDIALYWQSAPLADKTPGLSGRPYAMAPAVVFAAAPAAPDTVAVARAGKPASLAQAFAPHELSRNVKLARAVATDRDVTGSIDRAATQPARMRLASLGPEPDAGALDDAQPVRAAVYDISARTVYLPNGERLEAHSGLGAMLDDPRSVRVRMRGVTPPNVYRLKMRERLFHGVPAIRLVPEDEDAMFHRAGMLAHTYMLGPNGQSNGCVSFRDYPRFLAAFKRGEVDRMVVVTKLDRPPRFDGHDAVLARLRQDQATGRRLAYSGDADGGSEGRGIASSFTNWLSRLTGSRKSNARAD